MFVIDPSHTQIEKLENIPQKNVHKKDFSFTVTIIVAIGSYSIAAIGLLRLGVHQKWWDLSLCSHLNENFSIIFIITGSLCGSFCLISLYFNKKSSNDLVLNHSYPPLLSQEPQAFNLSNNTKMIEVDMYDEGRVEEVSNDPVYLFTDYLGPCIAAIGRCKLADSTMLIGITHLYAEDENYDSDLDSEVSKILRVNRINLKYLDKEKMIHQKEFKQQKLRRLIDKFLLHKKYKDETIELFFAGGNGNFYNAFWRGLTVAYAKSIPKVTVLGTYFNPFEATEEIQKEISGKKLPLCLQAGITEQGEIVLKKSFDIFFQFNMSIFKSEIEKI